MQTVIAGLVKDGFCRCPTKEQPTKAFASRDTAGTDVMVGEMIPPCITLCANSSFAGNTKAANGRFTEEIFVYSKPKLGKSSASDHFPAQHCGGDQGPLGARDAARAFRGEAQEEIPYSGRSRRTPPCFWASSCRCVPAVWSRL